MTSPGRFIYSGHIHLQSEKPDQMKAVFFASALIVTLLSGCALRQQADTQPASTPLPEVEYTRGELNRETLYELIVAEIAGQRKAYDVSLQNYLNQAQLTGDPAIAKRATYIAQYLQNPEALLEASRVWQQAEPENPEPYQIAASQLIRKGLHSEALPMLEKALQHAGKQTLIMIGSQADQLAPQEITAYIKQLHAYARQENSPELQTTLGVLYKQNSELNKALYHYDQALRLEPMHTPALFQKAELLREQEQFKPAIALIEPFLDKQADQQLFTLYVQLLFQAGDKQKAAEQAQLLIESFPDAPQLSFYVSLLLLENGNTVQSRQIMNDLLQRYPDNTTPHYYLGLIDQKEENNEAAIGHFLKVRDTNNVIQAFSRISALLDHPDNRQRLQTIMQEGRNSLPEIGIQLFVLEAEWLNLHDYKDRALNLLEEALTDNDNDVNLLYTRAMLLDPQDINLIESDLRQVLEIEPDNSAALNALGYTLTIYTDRFDEAYALISKAIQLEPDDPAIMDSMGWILFKQDKVTQAIPFLKQAYDIFPDPEVSGHLIQVYHAAGQTQQALDLLREELQKHPGNKFLLEAAATIGAEL